MRVYEFEDFNEAYFEFNRLVFTDPVEHVHDIFIAMAGFKNLVIETKSTNCDKIDLGAVGYRSGKWGHLLNRYLGKEKLHELRHFGTDVTGISVSFDFKRHNHGNGGCLLTMVLSREKHKGPWTEATFTWRSVHIDKKWPADLILIHKMLKRIPNTDIKKVTMIFHYGYVALAYAHPIAKNVIGVDPEILRGKVDPFSKSYIMFLDNYMYELKKKALATGIRAYELFQDYENGIIPEPIYEKDLRLPY